MDVSINTRLIACLGKKETLDFRFKLLRENNIREKIGIQRISEADFIDFCYHETHLFGFGISDNISNDKIRQYLSISTHKLVSALLNDIKLSCYFGNEVIPEKLSDVPYVGVFSMADTEWRNSRSLIDKGYIFLGEASFHIK